MHRLLVVLKICINNNAHVVRLVFLLYNFFTLTVCIFLFYVFLFPFVYIYYT